MTAASLSSPFGMAADSSKKEGTMETAAGILQLIQAALPIILMIQSLFGKNKPGTAKQSVAVEALQPLKPAALALANGNDAIATALLTNAVDGAVEQAKINGTYAAATAIAPAPAPVAAQ